MLTRIQQCRVIEAPLHCSDATIGRYKTVAVVCDLKMCLSALERVCYLLCAFILVP